MSGRSSRCAPLGSCLHRLQPPWRYRPEHKGRQYSVGRSARGPLGACSLRCGSSLVGENGHRLRDMHWSARACAAEARLCSPAEVVSRISVHVVTERPAVHHQETCDCLRLLDAQPRRTQAQVHARASVINDHVCARSGMADGWCDTTQLRLGCCDNHGVGNDPPAELHEC